MRNIFPSISQREKINPCTCCIGKPILGRIYILSGTAAYTYAYVAVLVRIEHYCICVFIVFKVL